MFISLRKAIFCIAAVYHKDKLGQGYRTKTPLHNIKTARRETVRAGEPIVSGQYHAHRIDRQKRGHGFAFQR
jgi:hypothetical protein